MKIAVIGAGGIGGYVGGRLAEAGEDVTLIARGAHLEALKKNGLRIETPGADASPEIRVVAHAKDVGPVDLIISAVKMTDARDAAEMMPDMLADHTRVLTLQNGIDGPSVAASVVGGDRVTAGTIFIASYIKKPGVIICPGGMQMMNVHRMNGDRVIADLLGAVERATALSAMAHDDPHLMLWQKFVPLSAFAAIGGVTRLPVGILRRFEAAAEFYRQLLSESMAVARAAGAHVGPEVEEKALDIFSKQPASMKPSLLVDLEAGKPCEIRWLSGKIHTLGKELLVATPGHSAVWAAIAPYEGGRPVEDGA